MKCSICHIEGHTKRNCKTLNIINYLDKYERITQLKFHLNLLKTSHEIQILNQTTLKNAHIYCIINNISSQQYGLFLEKYIINQYNFVKTGASECIGDCSRYRDNFEIKTSLGGASHEKFNFVQIRISQKINYYIFTAYNVNLENVEDEGELFIFKIPKKNIINILMNFGHYAHGTIKLNGKITLESLEDSKNLKEYALRPKINDKCWKELIKFRILENEI